MMHNSSPQFRVLFNIDQAKESKHSTPVCNRSIATGSLMTGTDGKLPQDPG